TDDPRVRAKLAATYLLQPEKEKQILVLAGLPVQPAQVRFQDGQGALRFRACRSSQREAAQHFLQRTGKFGHRDRLSAQFVSEIVKHGVRSVPDELGIE